jgi:hypothetical protein
MYYTSKIAFKKKVCFFFKTSFRSELLLNEYSRILKWTKRKREILFLKSLLFDKLDKKSLHFPKVKAKSLMKKPKRTKFSQLTTVRYRKFYRKYFKLVKEFRRMRNREICYDRIAHKAAFRAYYLQRRYYNVVKKRKPVFCFLTKTRTNIFLTVITNKGNVLFKASGGTFKAKKRRLVLSTVTSVNLAEFFLRKIRRYRISFIYFFLNIYLRSYLLKPFFFTLKKSKKLRYKHIVSIQRFSHNGCRFRKMQRK